MKAAIRNVKNSMLNYDEAEVRVREATSNDNWGASSSLMHEISGDTRNRYRYQSSLHMIHKRLHDFQHLNHVLKSLILIEFLLRNGDDRFVQDMQDRKPTIRRLRGYKYYKDNREIGGNVRKWANKVLSLLDNSEELNKERNLAKNTKDKIQGYSNDGTPKDIHSDNYEVEYRSPNSNASPKLREDDMQKSPDWKKSDESSPRKMEEENDASEDAPKKKNKKKKKVAANASDSENASAPASEKKPKKKAAPKVDEEEEEEEEQPEDGGEFDPDNFAQSKPKKGGKAAKNKSDDDGEFNFDEAQAEGAFEFGFEEEAPKPAEKPKKGEKKAAGGAGAEDDWMMAINPTPAQPAQKKQTTPVKPTEDALFDFSAQPKAAAAAQPAAEEEDAWNALTSVDLTGQKKAPQKKPDQKVTLNQIGVTGTSPVVDPFSGMFGSPQQQQPQQQVAPYGQQAYAGQPGIGGPYQQPMYANPYQQPPANYAGAYGAGQVVPYGMPQPQQQALVPHQPQQQAAKGNDPFAEFSW